MRGGGLVKIRRLFCTVHVRLLCTSTVFILNLTNIPLSSSASCNFWNPLVNSLLSLLYVVQTFFFHRASYTVRKNSAKMEMSTNIYSWGGVKVIYRWNLSDIWVSLHPMSKYSLKFQFSPIFFFHRLVLAIIYPWNWIVLQAFCIVLHFNATSCKHFPLHCIASCKHFPFRCRHLAIKTL